MFLIHRLIGLLSFAICMALLILAVLVILTWLVFPGTSPMY